MPSNRTIPAVCASCGKTFPYRAHRLKERPGARTYCSWVCRVAGPPPPAIIMDADGVRARVPLVDRNGTVLAHAIVDVADAPWVGQWTWRLANGYAHRSYRDANGKYGIPLHRAILGLMHGDGTDGDHISRDRLDCRRSNLRPLPKKGNQQNRPSVRGSSSAFRGVSWIARLGKWRAEVRAGDTLHYLGLFTDETEAAEVAQQARARLLPYAVD